MFANGLNVHINISGPTDGQPLLLMHGWGCTSDTVASIQKDAESICRVYNIDLPGFGQSEEPAKLWTVEDYAQMLRDIVEHFDIKRPVIAGHSFGGRVAIAYAGQYPGEVDKLILIDAAGIKPSRSWKYYFKVYSFKLCKKLAPLFLGKERAAKWIDKQRAKRGSSDYSSSSPMMRAIMSNAINNDLKHYMPSIIAPTLLIWGENDTATPIKDAHTMKRLIPNAGLVSFPGCGHYSFLDNPIQFAAVVQSFLRS